MFIPVAFFFQKAGGKLKNLLNRSSVKKALDKNYELKYASKNPGKVFTWENVFKVQCKEFSVMCLP